LVAGILNDLGNALTARRQFAEAIDVYAESRTRCHVETKQQALAATAQLNGAMALLQNRQLGEAHRHLDQAWSDMRSLGDGQAKTAGLLNIGLGYQELFAAMTGKAGAAGKADAVKGRVTEAVAATGSAAGLLRQSADAFTAAGEAAGRVGDARGQSYAWGYLGELREREHRHPEALEYSRKATFAAQKVTRAGIAVPLAMANGEAVACGGQGRRGAGGVPACCDAPEADSLRILRGVSGAAPLVLRVGRAAVCRVRGCLVAESGGGEDAGPERAVARSG
jgi:tetratricopeptide (TPR) repeat protein